MIATHSIKHDGVWYKVGDEVPESTSNSVPTDFMNPPETAYTKTEINRMSTADLKKLASENGIENATEINGSDLKKLLIEKFGL
nr:MAG TPA: Rho termination factor, N-terminal domain [Caudoviricetes sp.]